MKTYTVITNENDVPSYNYVWPNGNTMGIPPTIDNADYARMLEEIAAGEAEVRDEDGSIVVVD